MDFKEIIENLPSSQSAEVMFEIGYDKGFKEGFKAGLEAAKSSVISLIEEENKTHSY